MTLPFVDLDTQPLPSIELGPDDETLLGWLSDVAAVVDPVSPRVHALARAAFSATRAPAWIPDVSGR